MLGAEQISAPATEPGQPDLLPAAGAPVNGSRRRRYDGGGGRNASGAAARSFVDSGAQIVLRALDLAVRSRSRLVVGGAGRGIEEAAPAEVLGGRICLTTAVVGAERDAFRYLELCLLLPLRHGRRGTSGAGDTS